MNLYGGSALVAGGASGLGLATVKRLLDSDVAAVVIADLPASAGAEVVEHLGERTHFVASDVRNSDELSIAFDRAQELGPIRAVVHCAARGGPIRVLDKEGSPGSLDLYTEIVTTNLIGSFNVLRLAAERMAANEPVEGDRGVVIMTASVAAFEGQIGQIAYASSKAGVVGMTIVAARDLAGRQIRVNTIAPGTFATPLLARVSESVRKSLAAAVPHPKRLGDPDEYARLALAIIDNGMLNGETIRLDGAIRMAPR